MKAADINREIYVEKMLEYSDNGVDVYINGRKCDASQIRALLYLCEEHVCYMADYICEDNSGRITEIRLDNVIYPKKRKR